MTEFTNLIGGQFAATATIAEGEAARYRGEYESDLANYDAAVADYNAAMSRRQAGQERAVAQRAMIDEGRNADLVQSRALAVSGVSGGTGDTDIVNLMGDLENESDYRILTTLYEGDERAKALERAATAGDAEAGVLRATGAYAKKVGRAAEWRAHLTAKAQSFGSAASFYDGGSIYSGGGVGSYNTNTTMQRTPATMYDNYAGARGDAGYGYF